MILPQIHSPDDLKTLTHNERKLLAQEIRNRIIEVMAVNGGHLASNLGICELTIALHIAFCSPTDKFIWDVSHQTYVHKILTGRNERFDTIRQYKGLCGFSDPKESPHDHFNAGHAGTALSLAMGVAKNRDLAERSEYVIPIIGDATLTCGLALEALNNIPKELKKFIVILNDNKMSISKNVGAIRQILSRLLSNPTTAKLHEEIDALVSKIPLGHQIAKQGHKLTDSLKSLVSQAAFFGQFNLSYIGPIDGHDMKRLIETFEGIKDLCGPVLVHVLTNKGQGMEMAINNPVSYHGAKPFDLGTGKFLPTPSTKPTFPKVFGKQILEMAESDSTIAAITPAMSAGSCLDEFMVRFPDRCIDVGIAEGHAVTFSGGMAYGKNMKIVCSIYATFLQRAFDNLFHDVCIQQLPVIFALDRGGISGPDGTTHHGVYDISFLNAMPNMVICQPRDGKVLKELLSSAFSWERPTAIRYPNMATTIPEGDLAKRELGRAEVLIKGKGVVIFALGHMAACACEVREMLLQEGIDATVVDPVFVKPLDSEMISELLMTHDKIVTIEEHSVASGFGSILNHFLLCHGYSNIQVLNFGIPETFVEHGQYHKLMQTLGLDSESIAKKISREWAPKKVLNG